MHPRAVPASASGHTGVGFLIYFFPVLTPKATTQGKSSQKNSRLPGMALLGSLFNFL